MKFFKTNNFTVQFEPDGPLFESNAEYSEMIRSHINQLSKNNENQQVVKIGRLIGLAKSFDENAPMTSRKSAMSVMLELSDGRLLPSNVVVDPYFRRPLLGEYEDLTPEDYQEDIEPIEIFRGSRRSKYQPVGEKICRKTGFDTDYMDTGRTLLNFNEANYLMNNHEDIALLAIPWTDLKDLQMYTITQTLIHDVIGGKVIPGQARAQMKDTISEVLRAHSMSISEWEENVLILCTNTNNYSSSAEKIDLYEKLAKNRLEKANAYTLPIWTDLSVVTSY